MWKSMKKSQVTTFKTQISLAIFLPLLKWLQTTSCENYVLACAMIENYSHVHVRREDQVEMEGDNSLQGYTVPETPPQCCQEDEKNRDVDHERNEGVPPRPSSPPLIVPSVSTPSVINLDSSEAAGEESTDGGNDEDETLDSPMNIRERDPQTADSASLTWSEDLLLAGTEEVLPAISFDSEGWNSEGGNSMAGSRGGDDGERNSCEEEEVGRGVVKSEPEEEEQEEKARWVDSLNY